jgi:hypothetical protein
MLNMSQVNDIKDLAREGKRIGEISKKLKVDPNGKTAQAFDALIREVTKKGIL